MCDIIVVIIVNIFRYKSSTNDLGKIEVERKRMAQIAHTTVTQESRHSFELVKLRSFTVLLYSLLHI